MATAAVVPSTGNMNMLLPDGGEEVWELGMKSKWGPLGAWLKKTNLESLYVTNPASESHLAGYRTLINESRGRLLYPCNIVGTLIHPSNADSGHKFLKRVLALGVHPDVVDGMGRRALFTAVENLQFRCAEVLIMCRAKVAGQMFATGQTLLEFVKEQETANVTRAINLRQLLAVFISRTTTRQERIFTKGYPTIAELAYLKEFWAVKNRCRQRAVRGVESIELFEGRSAIEWAEHHGEAGLAAELRYFLQGVVSKSPRPLVPQNPLVQKNLIQPLLAANPFAQPVEEPVPPAPKVASSPSVPLEHLKTMQETLVLLANKVDQTSESIRSELQAEKKKIDDLSTLVNNLCQAQESKSTKLQAVVEGSIEPRLVALEEKVDSRNKEVPANSDLQPRARTGDPLCDVILGMLDNVADIAVAGPSIDLLEDVLVLVKKHKQLASSSMAGNNL